MRSSRGAHRMRSPTRWAWRAHGVKNGRERSLPSADGRRQTADGRRQTADGRRQTADGRRQTA
ncbi:pristinamycin I synthase 3 and 4, partial [Burkholderia pseudomallei]